DVINAMNMNPQISFPPEVDFTLISPLIRETCRVAFAMQTLDPPLDLAFASDGELYNDTKLVLCRLLGEIPVSVLPCSKYSAIGAVQQKVTEGHLSAAHHCYLMPQPADVTLGSHMMQTHISLLYSRYRRSFDSEFTAPLVIYHVWPALVEGNTVIVKGEAVTRRGALVNIS
ncbi:hypothetical protein GOODEAATRI_007980, partial [Goodea atripinnis]